MREVERIEAKRDGAFVFDPGGFFVILLDRSRGVIVVEHYENVTRDARFEVTSGRLLRVIEGRDAESLSHTLARLGLVTRLDHALYLGRELAKAELALTKGIRYEQGAPLDLRRREGRRRAHS